jgi:DNA-binding XRE family transcriptional regulator
MHANRIREFRQKRGIGMTELAYRIGRSVGALQQYEVGAVSPPLPVARQIASVLSAPLDDVFPEGTHTDDPAPAAA